MSAVMHSDAQRCTAHAVLLRVYALVVGGSNWGQQMSLLQVVDVDLITSNALVQLATTLCMSRHPHCSIAPSLQGPLDPESHRVVVCVC